MYHLLMIKLSNNSDWVSVGGVRTTVEIEEVKSFYNERGITAERFNVVSFDKKKPTASKLLNIIEDLNK